MISRETATPHASIVDTVGHYARELKEISFSRLSCFGLTEPDHGFRRQPGKLAAR
jgi:hypothetical protein